MVQQQNYGCKERRAIDITLQRPKWEYTFFSWHKATPNQTIGTVDSKEVGPRYTKEGVVKRT